ncbi:hypothetical protein [Streptomyces sp. NPDC056949]|uniref:hypothetical protein n=1 Tax=Streptomyces sp. NPDC056949 TaxID=3345976 RepID=UPI00362D45E8
MNPVPRLTRCERMALVCATVSGAISGLVRAATSTVFMDDSTGAWSWPWTLRPGCGRSRAVLRLTAKGYTDGEIADMLQPTPVAVRNQRYRFRTDFYEAAREGRIWIPGQLYTVGATDTAAQDGAA